MHPKDVVDFTCEHNDTLRTALKKIEANTKGIILVLNNDKVIGVITDGDVRRLILDAKYDLDVLVSEVCNKNFVYALDTDPEEKVISTFSDQVKFLPIVNQKRKLIDIQFDDVLHHRRASSRVCARAPARITFGGGGSDKYDYFKNEKGLCINAAIKKYAFCTLITGAETTGVKIISVDYNACWTFANTKELFDNSDPRLLIYQTVLSFLRFDSPIEIVTHCDFPVGSGLGGSSSLVVAMLSAFGKLRGTNISKRQIAKDAYKLERLAMKVSGGWQDQYAASVGGVNAIFFAAERHDVHNIRLSSNVLYELEETLYLCFTGITHDSDEIHLSIDLTENIKRQKMKETVRLADEMLRALIDDDLSKFDSNMNENWELKKQYSSKITNSLLDQKLILLQNAGASAVKLLGAGGGGYILARVPVEQHRKFFLVCKNNEIYPERILFDHEGAKSW